MFCIQSVFCHAERNKSSHYKKSNFKSLLQHSALREQTQISKGIISKGGTQRLKGKMRKSNYLNSQGTGKSERGSGKSEQPSGKSERASGKSEQASGKSETGTNFNRLPEILKYKTE